MANKKAVTVAAKTSAKVLPPVAVKPAAKGKAEPKAEPEPKKEETFPKLGTKGFLVVAGNDSVDPRGDLGADGKGVPPSSVLPVILTGIGRKDGAIVSAVFTDGQGDAFQIVNREDISTVFYLDAKAAGMEAAKRSEASAKHTAVMRYGTAGLILGLTSADTTRRDSAVSLLLSLPGKVQRETWRAFKVAGKVPNRADAVLATIGALADDKRGPAVSQAKLDRQAVLSVWGSDQKGNLEGAFKAWKVPTPEVKAKEPEPKAKTSAKVPPPAKAEPKAKGKKGLTLTSPKKVRKAG